MQIFLEWAICGPHSQCKTEAEVSSRGRRIFGHLAAVCVVCESAWNNAFLDARPCWQKLIYLAYIYNAFPSSNKPSSVTQKKVFSALLSSALPLGFSDPNHCHSTCHVIHHREMQKQLVFDNRQHSAFWQSRLLSPVEFTRWLGQHLLRLTGSPTPCSDPQLRTSISHTAWRCSFDWWLWS